MAPRMPVQLTSLPTEILFLIIFCIDNAKDLRSLSSTNHLFRTLAGPHTVTARLWFAKCCRDNDIPPEELLKEANNCHFSLETEFAKELITINAPPEPPGISREPPGPKRALRRQERVVHIVERFSLFLHNMLAVDYYNTHDWDSLQRVADSVECYLEDFGWVQFYRGQMDNGINSLMVATVEADQEFEAVAFEDFAKKLKADIAAVSTITTSSSSKKIANNSRHNSSRYANNNDSSINSDDIRNDRNSELFASLSPEPVYLRWTSLIQDQLNFFCLQQYIMDKFKPPSKLQLAEYLSVVLFGDIETSDLEPATTYSSPTTTYLGSVTSYSRPTTSYSRLATSYSRPDTTYSEPTTSYLRPTTFYSESTTSYSGSTTFYSGSTTSNSGSTTSNSK